MTTAVIGTFDRQTAVRRSLEEPGRVFACMGSRDVVRDGRAVRLNGRRFAVFVVLATGMLVTHEQVLDAAWPDPDDQPFVEAVRNKVYFLRAQLRVLGLDVVARWGFGIYKLVECDETR